MTTSMTHILASTNLTLMVTLVAIFAGSFAAGLAGFAFSATAGAILFHWVAPLEAVPLLLVCSITTQLFSVASLWRTMQWRQCLPYLAGGLVGIPVGARLLENFNSHTFAAGFGLFLICYSTYMLLRPNLAFRAGSRLPRLLPALPAASPVVQRPFPAPFRPSGAI